MKVEAPPQSATLQTAPIQTKPVIASMAPSATTQPKQKVEINHSSDGNIQGLRLPKGYKLGRKPDGKLKILATRKVAGVFKELRTLH